MGLTSIIKRNRRVCPSGDDINNNHKPICLCRKCKKRRRKETNTACMALCPLVGLIALISAIA